MTLLTDNDGERDVVYVIEFDARHVVDMIQEKTDERQLNESQQRFGFVNDDSVERRIEYVRWTLRGIKHESWILLHLEWMA